MTTFTTECAGYGLVARDVAATVEANPKIWIEPDGAKRERVGDLLGRRVGRARVDVRRV